jgi:hypothetical protein
MIDLNELRPYAHDWGRASYNEWRENIRIISGLSQPVWDSLSHEQQTMWESIAMAAIHLYSQHLSVLLAKP